MMKTEDRRWLPRAGSAFAGMAAGVLGIIVALLLPGGCERADVYTMDPRTNFEALWRIIDEHYCFFEYKQVDWDDVHRKYGTLVADSMDKYELFDVLGDMLGELKDGHTNLISSFNVARYWEWYENYPRNFNEDIHSNYLRECRISGGVRYGRLADDKVGYVYCGSFSNAVSESGLNEIFLYFKDCRGMIIDVRDNGGGALSNSDRMAARFPERDTVAGYIMHKTGPGHGDFSAPYPIVLKASEYVTWLRPVVVLTNRHSYSATNDFVNKMRCFPQVTIMGDRTGGGSGLPFNSELPNGWRVRFSASPLLDADGQCAEDGIDPDIRVDMLQVDGKRGMDTIIETAVAFLLNHEQRGEP